MDIRIIGIIFIAALFNTVSCTWVAKHGLTGTQFQTEFNSLTSTGYKLTSFTGYNDGINVRFACIFDTTGPSFYALFGISAATLVSSTTTYKADGFRLTSISGYIDGGIKYAAIWQKSLVVDWKYEYALTSAQYQTQFNFYTSQGYRLIFVNTVSFNNIDYYSAIFDKTPITGWVARHRMNSTEYQTEFNLRVGQGYKPAVVSGCRTSIVNGVANDYYAALFVKPVGVYTYANHGVRASWYQGVFDNLRYQGFVPKYLNAFASDGTALARFNTIWENTAISSSNMQLMDNAVNNYLTTQGVTGLSVAVMSNERLVFAKSYGRRDVGTGEPLSPIHSLRIMSISKTVTAFAIVRLIQAGQLSLNSRIFGAGSVFGINGSTYTYPSANKVRLEMITIDMLLRHRAGLRSCNGENVFWNSGSTATQAMQVLLNDATGLFLSTPNTQYNYSNTGFYFLARVVEKISGLTYENYVRSNVLNQCGIGASMFVGRADGNPNPTLECSYNPVSQPNMQRWDGFGGWVARPIDLLRMFARMNGETVVPDILTLANTNTMRTDNTGMNYGQGLILNAAFGTRFGHNGCHGSSRSFLWKYSNSITFSVIINSKPSNDGCSWTLKSAIESALAAIPSWPAYDLF